MGLMAMAVISSSLSATSLFFDRGFDNDFDRFQRLANEMFNSHMAHVSLEKYTYPKLNMSENDKEYKLKFELAGIKKEDIKLTLDDDNVLTLEGNKKQESKEKNATYYREEISYGTFIRAIQLPKNADPHKMQTHYQDGVLIITIPKTEVKKPATKIIKID